MALDDLRTLEREAFRKFYEDGLFDVFLGLILMMMGVSSAIARLGLSERASTAVFVVAIGAMTVGMIALRHHVLRPRLGTFKPGPARMHRIKATRFVLLASVGLGLAAWATLSLGPSPVGLIRWVPLIFLANCVVVFGLLAYFLDVPRFLLYGFLFPAPMIVAMWLGPFDLARTLVAFGASAAIIVGIGLFKLTRFLRGYPVRATGVPRVS